jgi:hypothetical protein
MLLPIQIEARERVDITSERREALRGVNALKVRVEIYERGDAADGLTADQLDRAIRSKIRDAAFVPDEYGPYAANVAEIRVTISRLNTEGSTRIYGVQVGLYQLIDLPGPRKHVFVRVWGDDRLRASATASGIRDIVDEDVGSLLIDLAAANPGKRHPVSDPRPIAPATRCDAPEPGHAGSALRILVRDQRGNALPYATVRYSRSGETTVEYPPMAWVKPGWWHVEVSAQDCKPASYDIEVIADKVCSTTVYLEDSNFRYLAFDAECPACGEKAALLVNVTDEGGAALPGVRLNLDGLELTANDKGVLRLDDVAPGKHVIVATLGGFDGGEIQFTAVGGRQSVVHVTLSLSPAD